MPKPPTEFEARAHALVGRLVFVYSRLDVNLAMYVANRFGFDERARSIQKLESASFKEKLEWLLPAANREYPSDGQCHAAWSEWLGKADAVRKQRNNFVHGRWGIYEHLQLVSNIVLLPGSPNQAEVKYTLSELAATVEEAAVLAEEFLHLSKRWPA
jgi:hypothetical protein